MILKLLKICNVSTWGFLKAKASAVASLHHICDLGEATPQVT